MASRARFLEAEDGVAPVPGDPRFLGRFLVADVSARPEASVTRARGMVVEDSKNLDSSLEESLVGFEER